MMASEAMVSFLRNVAPGIEQSLQQNETVDIFEASWKYYSRTISGLASMQNSMGRDPSCLLEHGIVDLGLRVQESGSLAPEYDTLGVVGMPVQPWFGHIKGVT